MNKACFSKNTSLHEQKQHASCIRPFENNFVQMKISTYMKFLGIVGLTFALFAIAGCGTLKIGTGKFGYNLSGAQVNPKCKTAYIEYFKNQASLVQPLLAQKLTDKLKDKMLSQTSLKLTNNTGDVNFQGTIESYTTQPMAPQSGAVIAAALNRLSISIKVKYSNAVDSKDDYDASFSRYIQYESVKNLNDVESSKDFDDMLDKLIQDIFDRAFVNW